MADPELVRTLDFILNRCDENDIGAVAEAVIRRRRQLTMFGGAANLPDPHKMAQELSAKMDISGAINGLNNSVRDMAMRIIKQEAPELTDAQVAELTAAWIPRPQGSQGAPQSPPPGDKGAQVPEGILRSMIDQFVAFSRGTMDQKEDQELRNELGSWPERYWKAFPPVIRLFVTDYLKGEFGEKDFLEKIDAAFSMGV